MAINKVESDLPSLKPPYDLYYDSRYFGDWITFLLLMIYPLCRFYNICNTFWLILYKKNDGLISTAT